MLVMMGSALLATAAVAQDAPAQPQPAANPEPAAKTTEVKKADMKQERVEWEKKIKTELNLTAEQSANHLQNEFHFVHSHPVLLIPLYLVGWFPNFPHTLLIEASHPFQE